uniref:F-box domain-containing protein n=1 Tax=Panagrolaimus sp. JU765 TaxID=591449 RepID=A0AC34R269_9BILA
MNDEERSIYVCSLLDYQIKNQIENQPYDSQESEVVNENVPNEKFTIKNLPYSLFLRFVELLPGLSAHKLSFTNKELYTELLQIRGIPIHAVNANWIPKVTSEGVIFNNLEKIPPNLLSYVKVQSLCISDFNEDEQKIIEKLNHVDEKHKILDIHTDKNGEMKHLTLFHPGIRHAIIFFHPNYGNLNEILDLLPNVELACFFMMSVEDMDYEQILETINNWIYTKPIMIKAMMVALTDNTFYFLNNKWSKEK